MNNVQKGIRNNRESTISLKSKAPSFSSSQSSNSDETFKVPKKKLNSLSGQSCRNGGLHKKIDRIIPKPTDEAKSSVNPDTTDLKNDNIDDDLILQFSSKSKKNVSSVNGKTVTNLNDIESFFANLSKDYSDQTVISKPDISKHKKDQLEKKYESLRIKKELEQQKRDGSLENSASKSKPRGIKRKVNEELVKPQNDIVNSFKNSSFRRMENKIKKALDNDTMQQIQNTKYFTESLPSGYEDDDTDNNNEDIYNETIDIGFKNNYSEVDEQKNFNKQKKVVDLKYGSKQYPGKLTEYELERKVTKYLESVPDFLKTLKDSQYYQNAAKVAESSSSVTISRGEFVSLPKDEIMIGFYGTKRQSIMASIIKQKFEKQLEKMALKNKVIQFWSIDSFVLYVICCEVAAGIASDELNISKREAYKVLKETNDYGKYITDEYPLF
ncbi:hypothetical protein WICMUC_000535 [Wickerhamomyces mucosus]|uniref:Restriction of telomere capping protein 4 n=1 Tax=Wickerhamomyces mucosus TaxID=1378264 RepID=A0A9P8TIK2_9ASCO|nr:hypothetical protein WICMUC_000535 [Wickerhamomyces mucosus]